MWRVFGLFLVLNGASARSNSKIINFGSFTCPREENALGKCLKENLNDFIPQLASGIPEFNIPPCEPLEVPAMTIEQSSGAIQVTSFYSDVTVSGPSTMKIHEVKVDGKKNEVVAKLTIPELNIKGKYKLAGQVLMLPIEGDGTFTGTYGDIDAKVVVDLGRKPRANGKKDALTCEDLQVSFQIATATMQLDNLFGGNDELGNAMNKVLNENWEKLAEELQTPMESALREFLKPIADHVFSTLDADDVLLSRAAEDKD